MFTLISALALWLNALIIGTPSVTVTGPPPTPSVVCTFDDGPRTWILPQLLDFLKENNMHCTFFVLGMNIENSKEGQKLIRRAVREGHEIANHTYWHARIPEFIGPGKTVHGRNGKEWFIDDQVLRNARVIESVAGYRPIFFRPRSWEIPEFSKIPITCEEFKAGLKRKGARAAYPPKDILYKEELICDYGYQMQVLDDPKLDPMHRSVRDVNTVDYEFHEAFKKNPERASAALARVIQKSITSRERAGVHVHILGMHELPVTLEALKIVVPEWKAKGYKMKTLREVYGL